jgi:hypothetical protein
METAGRWNHRCAWSGDGRPENAMAAPKDLRPLNDHRRRRFGAPGRTLALLCECGEAGCMRTVLLTTAEYDAARPGPILHPDHEPKTPTGGAA